MPTGSRSPVVVVGVDASAQSLAALRWAAEYARVTGGRLRAVTAWHCPTTYGIAPDWTGMDFAAEAAQQLETALTATMKDFPAISVDSCVVEGLSAPVLLDAAHDADLVVVGSHGHGHLAGMLLGSVSSYCVEHAPCPVLVVRGQARAGGAGEPLTASASSSLGAVQEPAK